MENCKLVKLLILFDDYILQVYMIFHQYFEMTEFYFVIGSNSDIFSNQEIIENKNFMKGFLKALLI